MARVLLIISGIIAIVVREFLPGSNIPQGDHPEGVRRCLDFTVRVTRMIAVTSRILQCLAINRVLVRQMKDVSVASGSTQGAFLARNLRPNVLHDPRTLGNILGCEEALPSNPRRTSTYLTFHQVADSLCSPPSQAGIRVRPVHPCRPTHMSRLTPLVYDEHVDGERKRLALEMPCLKEALGYELEKR